MRLGLEGISGLGASEKIQEETKSRIFSGMIYRNVVAGRSRGIKCLPVF